MPVYEPPFTKEPMEGMDAPGSRPMLSRYTWNWGETVYKSGGEWTVKHVATHDELDGADALPDDSESSYPGKYAWVGGHKFEVSEDIRTEIENAGVGGTFT